MKLSEYLRITDLKLPIRLIIRTDIIGNIHDDYIELMIITKQDKDDINPMTLYKIQYMSDCQNHHTNEVRWVDDSWCAKYEIVKILL